LPASGSAECWPNSTLAALPASLRRSFRIVGEITAAAALTSLLAFVTALRLLLAALILVLISPSAFVLAARLLAAFAASLGRHLRIL
jgi:hypothetical protein